MPEHIGAKLQNPVAKLSIRKRETQILKLRPFAYPNKAARRLLEHAHAFEPIQDGRIYIEKLNGPFLFGDKGHARGIPRRLEARRGAGLAGAPRQRNIC